jgi:predicted ATP-dependent endonuclease of OLD family
MESRIMPNLNLKNFAKIADSDFNINDITVFAGKPGTGKSYIMKTLYAIDEAVNKTSSEILSAKDKLEKIEAKYGRIKDVDHKKLSRKELIDLKNSIEAFLTFKSFDKDKLKNHAYKNILESIFGDLYQISNNFAVNHKEVILRFYDDIFTVDFVDQSETDEDDDDSDYNVIFVETPLIIEFKKFMTREKGKTPYHIESLLNILDKDYSFTDIEQDEFIKSFVSKSKEIINGSIEDSGDSFVFKSNEKSFDIINASSGIKSIGLLQYLVTNKALKKDSTLYWEEPEVHLHPTWQLKMVELFIELMNAGVKIVFSTHSPYMADYLNALSKKKELRDRVSFNLLSEINGVVSNTILDGTNWSQLREELLEPLEEIMWEYL